MGLCAGTHISRPVSQSIEIAYVIFVPSNFHLAELNYSLLHLFIQFLNYQLNVNSGVRVCVYIDGPIQRSERCESFEGARRRDRTPVAVRQQKTQIFKQPFLDKVFGL